MKKPLLAVVVASLTLYALTTSAMIVRESDSAIIFQFGRVVRVIDNPGLYWKLPSPIQTRLAVSRRTLMCDPKAREFLTGDKKNVVLDYFFTFRITDPLQFHKVLKDRRIAEVNLDDMVYSALGTELGRFELTALISIDPKSIRLPHILDEVLAKASHGVANSGVVITSVQVKRLTFPKENEKAVFARMYSERQQIATSYRAEGMEEARKIRARADLEAERIRAKATGEAEAIRGEADAQALKIYTETWRHNPELYSYIRRLEIYRKAVNKEDIMILGNDPGMGQGTFDAIGPLFAGEWDK